MTNRLVLSFFLSLYQNKSANETHFYMKDFARRLILKQRHKVTKKWPVTQKCVCLAKI